MTENQNNFNDKVYVHEYTRDDGTHVDDYYRSKPGHGTKQSGTSILGVQLPFNLADIITGDWMKLPEEEGGSQNPLADCTNSAEYTKKQEEFFNKLYILLSVVNYEYGGGDDIMSQALSGAAGLADMQAEKLGEKTNSNAYRYRKEQERNQKMQNFMFFADDVLHGRFKDADWRGMAKQMNIQEYLSMINPKAGAAATFLIDVLPESLNAVHHAEDGEKKEMISSITKACLGGISMLSEMSGPLAEKIGETMNVGDRAEALEVFGEIKDLEQSGYRYEMLVKAELFKDADKELSKIKQLAGKMKSGFEKMKSVLKEKGNPTGYAADTGMSANYDPNKPFELHAEYDEILNKKPGFNGKNYNPLHVINSIANKHAPDAQEWFDISIEGPKKAPESSEYFFAGTMMNEALNKTMNLSGNAKIQDNWDGIVFNYNSTISQNLAKSEVFKNQIRANYDYKTGKFKSDKISVNLNGAGQNLYYSIGHATVIAPNVTRGYFTGWLFDMYDFDYVPLKDTELLTYVANTTALNLQKMMVLKNYYVLVPVKFKL